MTIKKGDESNILVLSSNKLVKNIFINAPGVKLSDNYFDIVPGFSVKVQILSEGHDFAYLKKAAKFTSVREASIKEELKVKF